MATTLGGLMAAHPTPWTICYNGGQISRIEDSDGRRVLLMDYGGVVVSVNLTAEELTLLVDLVNDAAAREAMKFFRENHRHLLECAKMAGVPTSKTREDSE